MLQEIFATPKMQYYNNPLFWEVEVKLEARGGAYMVLVFLAILKLVVLIEVVLIKKACISGRLVEKKIRI